MAPGIVVIDSTFLRHLLAPSTVRRLHTQLRLTDLELVPSIANVIEALKHTNATSREVLLSAIQDWSGEQPLNPWPLDLLRLAGQALQAGRISFRVDDDSPNSVRVRREALEDDHHRAIQFLKALEDSFVEPYKRHRESFQRQLKRKGRTGSWPDLPAFLEFHNDNEASLAELAQLLWEYVGLSGNAASTRLLRQSEVWRLALDGFGAAMYERAVVKEQPRNAPGFVDLLQLVYLAGSPRARIFVTNDNALHRTATSILRGRYANVRVMLAEEFIPPAA